MATTKANSKMDSSKMSNSAMGCDCACHTGPWMKLAKVVMIVVTPLLLIWSLNRLFYAGIAYTVYTWFAALVIVFVLSGKAMKKPVCMMCGCGGHGQCNCGMQK